MNITQIIIAIGVVIIFAIDGLLLAFRGLEGTISRQLYLTAVRWPVVAFALGFIFGHIFWSNCP